MITSRMYPHCPKLDSVTLLAGALTEQVRFWLLKVTLSSGCVKTTGIFFKLIPSRLVKLKYW